ncbi:DUF6197 family protein [Streptomyces decoyicus]|uniref:DUF6197 family protein n=1 Tax=Streptomyces decoyicus TaxID=249567 RepID=UPI003818CBB6
MSETTTAVAVSVPVWQEALNALTTLPEHVWTGRSGEPVTAAAVTCHLQATADLLGARGWVRTAGNEDTGVELPEAGEMTVKAMLSRLYMVARNLLGPDTQSLTLSVALWKVGQSTTDSDTENISLRVLDAVVTARTGARSASSSAWAEREGRTWAEITQLLATGAAASPLLAPTSTSTQAA